MTKKPVLTIVFKAVGIAAAVLFAMALVLSAVANFQRYREIAEARRAPAPAAADPLNATYVVDGARFTMHEGTATVAEDDVIVTTTVFGPPTYGDLDGDGDEDAAVVLMTVSGGTGTFFSVAAAINGANGYEGTAAVFVGDRVSPDTTDIKDGVILHNYADRFPWEPFVTKPSVGKTKRLKYENGALKEINGPALTQEEAQGLATKAWGDCMTADCATFTVETLDGVDGVWYVQATYDGFMDDSVKAERRVAMAHATGDGWVLGALITETRQCREGRGHQEFSSEPCK